jgi:replicative DNA helicase
MTDCLPPHDKSAEAGILGAVLRYPENLSTALDYVKADSFYFAHHQCIFRAMCDLYTEGKEIDVLTVRDLLSTRKQLADCGGQVVLVELYEGEPIGARIEYHCSVVRGKAQLRNLLHAAREIARDAVEAAGDPDELVSQAEQKIFELSSLMGQHGGLRHISEFTANVLAEIDKRQAGHGDRGIPSGYADLDEYIGGFKKGQLIVIGARPGSGKSAIGLNFMARAAMSNIGSGIFSMEMPAESIVMRFVSIATDVSYSKMDNGIRLQDH